jgi:hypothetical protein
MLKVNFVRPISVEAEPAAHGVMFDGTGIWLTLYADTGNRRSFNTLSGLRREASQGTDRCGLGERA